MYQARLAFRFFISAAAALALAVPAITHAAILYPPSVPQAGAGQIVGLIFQNPNGGSLPAHEVEFGQPFVDGALAGNSGLSATVNGSTVPAQVDIKTKYPDGSARFGVVTVLAPAISGSAPVMLSPLSAGTPISLSSMPGYSFTVDLVISGKTYHFDAASLLAAALNAGKASYWRQGPVVSEARVDAPVTSSMHLVFDISEYADGTYSTDVQFDNDYAWSSNDPHGGSGGTVSYTATVTQNGSTVYSGTLTEYQYQQWHEEFWTNGAPGVNVQHDVAYLIKTGTIPNYDIADGIDTSGFVPESYSPLSSAGIAKYMPTTGDRPDVGPTTSQNADWLLSQDASAAKYALAQADAAGTVPWHYFDPNTGDYLSLVNYPTLWTDSRGNPTLKQFTGATDWTLDNAHEPDLSFVPYLLTGSRWDLDQLNAQATFSELVSWNGYRGDGKGLMINFLDQVRGQAWPLRQIDEAMWANPDGSADKSYWTGIVNNNYQNWISNFSSLQSQEGSIYGYLPGDYEGSNPPNVVMAPWQQDYLMTAVAQAALFGDNDAKTVLNWIANWSAGRFLNSSQGMQPASGVNYNLSFTTPASWSKVGAQNPPDSLANCEYCDYGQLGLMAQAELYNATGNASALQAYNTLLPLHPNFPDLASMQASYLAGALKFHIIPSGSGGTPPPTASLSANPSSITAGQTAVLTWSSTNATSCAGTNFSTGGAVSGSTGVTPAQTTTYTVNCTGAGGQASAQTTVSVSSGSTKFTIGERVETTETLNVRQTPSLSGTLLGTQPPSALGTVIGGPVAADGYTWWDIDYDNSPDGWSVEDYLVEYSGAAAPTASLSANPSSITSGQSSTLTWGSTNADSCTGTGFSTGGAAAGSAVVTPSQTTTYSVTCTGAGGQASAQTTVSVSSGSGGGGSGPVAEWPFDGSFADASGNGINGQGVNGPTFGAGEIAQAVSLGGSSYVSLPGNSLINLTSAGTIGGWFYVSTPATGQDSVWPIFVKLNSGNGSDNGGVRLVLYEGAGGSPMHLMGEVSNKGTNQYLTGPSIIPNGSWHYATLAWDGSTVALYLDGKLETSQAQSAPVAYYDTNAGAYIGRASGSVKNGYANGLIDDVRLYNRALSASEIAALALGSAPPPPTASLSANPSSIAAGQSSTLTWSSTGADSCSGTGFSTGGAVSGSASVTPAQTTTYTVLCTGSNGSANAAATVTVSQAAAPTVTIAADPSQVSSGGSSKVSWSSTDANSCIASGDWNGSKATSGSQTFNGITSPQTYTLTCTGAGGQASGSATVTIKAAAQDTFSFHVSGDYSPQFKVYVNGAQVGGIQTVTANHAQDQWKDVSYTGSYPDAQTVDIQFINDGYTKDGHDINLYVQSLTYDGVVYPAEGGMFNKFDSQGFIPGTGTEDLYWDGTLRFVVNQISALPVSRGLAMGASGADVMTLQQILSKLGYFKTSVTGYFGSITESALAAFQQANGLAAVGAVGPLTKSLLQSRFW
ncbi:MAG TPA: LamG-like jellyroll fold domain-containing protein [Candidatus Paceibacterota bacterium]|nr:LamG-like jellyroll fold domain-containing protein [Candidatus Paceibacterota bacterium]